MRKSFGTVLVLILMLSITTGTALAVNLDAFNPAKETNKIPKLSNPYYTNTASGKFTSAAPSSANEKGRRAIKPVDTDYHNGVIKGKNHKTTVIRGKQYGKNSEVYKRATLIKKSIFRQVILIMAIKKRSLL